MFRGIGGRDVALTDAGGTIPSIAPANADQMRGLPDIGFWECDLRDNSLNWTQGVFELFGLPSDVMPARSDTVACYCEDSREAMELLRAYAIRHRRGFTLDARIARPNGQHRWMRLTASVGCNRGRARLLYGTKQDITQEHDRRRALRGAVDIDAMSGLFTRAGFEWRFVQMLVSRSFASGLLLLIDVDDIDLIRRRFGAIAADACLGMIGSALARNASDNLIVGRLDDCRFAVFISGSAGEGAMARSVEAVLRAVAEPIFWQGYLLRIVPSYGTAMAYGDAERDPATLFSTAAERLSAARFDSDRYEVEGRKDLLR
jgi:GGDEF domain-containing protein